MLEVIAFIPFERGFQSFERFQILIVAADGVFDGGHDGITGPPFAIAEAEVDGLRLRPVLPGIVRPMGEPNRRRRGSNG